MFRRTVWVVVTDHNGARKQEPLSGVSEKPRASAGKLGPLELGTATNSAPLIAECGLAVQCGTAKQARLCKASIRPSTLYSPFNLRDPLRTDGVVPIALLDADEFRM
jgi:hypothetical protein